MRAFLLTVAANRRMIRLIQFTEACKYLDLRVWDHEDGNRQIYEALMSGKPLAIGKLGSVELFAIRKYLQYRNHPKVVELTALNRQTLYANAGVFPDDYAVFQRYCQSMIQEVLPEMTLIAVWFHLGESTVIRKFCRCSITVNASSLQAIYKSSLPWTAALAGKKVLVVHPFDKTIRLQYQKRKDIWRGLSCVMPDFDLDVLKVPFSPALVPPTHKNWFESLNALKEEMALRDYDVALIGAGAYSLPLAVHAKHLGKQGIHLGGATQFYFGIKGKRWDKTDESQYYNEHWIRPLVEDTPPNNAIIEGGCYW